MKKVMDRRAADNKYLHRDFHISTDVGVSYVGELYGDNGVREYLTVFATRYYSPLVEKTKTIGLKALEDHILNIYEIEEASDAVVTELTENELRVKIAYCPGVKFMKAKGRTPSQWYIELTRTVNMVIADNAGLGFELISYDEDTGAAEYRFFRRSFL